MNFQRSLALLSLALISPVFISPVQAQAPAQVESIQRMKVYPLPGQLDNLPMFNSNSPEIVDGPGILLSTLPGAEGSTSPFLDYAFQGDFGVFSHHIAKDQHPGERLLYTGLIASNLTGQPIKLTFKSGASYLSQPDALFQPMMAYRLNPMANIYAGPGDRVATELIAGKNLLKTETLEIPAYSSQLVYSLPIPTDVKILPPINGRSTLMYFHSDGPVHLSELAWYASGEKGSFAVPTLEDYREVLNTRQLSQPREQAPPEYDPTLPPSGSGFRYGRVAGVSQGLTWKGTIFAKTDTIKRPGPGEKIAFPISSVYLKRWGTPQNQSGQMFKRYPDTAYQSHGNYGVRYELNIPLHNQTSAYQTYALGFNQPARMIGPAQSAEMTYLYPPNKQVVYRGTVRLDWVDEYNIPQTQLVHLALRHGEEAPPLTMLTLPPQTNYDVKLSFIYPADATPPQLLTIARIE